MARDPGKGGSSLIRTLPRSASEIATLANWRLRLRSTNKRWLMSRIGIATALGMILLVTSSQAAPQLRMMLTSQLNPTATTANGGTPVFDVSVYAQTTGTQTSSANGDGGVSGLQFDLLSDGTGKAQPLQQGSDPAPSKAKLTWAPEITSNFNTILPLRTDAIAAQNPTANPPYAADGDLDAVGASFSDAAAFSDTTLGLNNFALLGTEQWELNTGNLFENLRLYIVGPTYYDFTKTQSNFMSNYLAGQYRSGQLVIPLSLEGS